MRKLKRRFKRWQEWRSYTSYGFFTQLLIFLGIKKGTGFDIFLSLYDLEHGPKTPETEEKRRGLVRELRKKNVSYSELFY